MAKRGGTVVQFQKARMTASRRAPRWTIKRAAKAWCYAEALRAGQLLWLRLLGRRAKF